MTLAPNFDFVLEKNRTAALANLITNWVLEKPEDGELLASFPGEYPGSKFVEDLKDVPIETRNPQGQGLYKHATQAVAAYSEDEFISFHMALLLKYSGTNLRAHLYQHAMSRAGLETTPVRDTLKVLDSIVKYAFDHDWLWLRDWSKLKDCLANHEKIAEDD